MVAVKGKGNGGARAGAGHPAGTPNVGSGKTHGTVDVMPHTKDGTMDMQRWQFAEHAIRHAYEALDGMINLMRNAESEAVRLNAMDKILDRALGKAPQHIDVTALRHTEIVYRSADEIRAALLGRGLPPALLDLRPAAAKDDDDDIVD
jgi:hypothetical protein